jgi:mannitol-1-phosphate 5-dehydrogenase
MKTQTQGRVYVGFGFGAIQAGLFAREAFRSGGFDRLVVAEVAEPVVEMVRRAGGAFGVNIAEHDGVRAETVSGVELYNPRQTEDRRRLVEAIAASAEMATALPSVNFYGDGARADHVTGLLRDGLARKRETNGPPALVYTAENHNHAAEVLHERLAAAGAPDLDERLCCLNTVIGKMSGAVTDPLQILEQGLQPAGPDAAMAFLVEAFHRILISRVERPAQFVRRIAVFEEKADLLPFEEAKLYGHNATHALIGCLLARRHAAFMSAAGRDAALMAWVREAFLRESGAALCRKYAGSDPLFTPAGFAEYADDLLARMTNPHLRDRVDRIIRDLRRKLDWNDRLVGTMRLALSQGIAPVRYAVGAAVALEQLARTDNCTTDALVQTLWPEAPPAERQIVLDHIAAALSQTNPQGGPS